MKRTRVRVVAPMVLAAVLVAGSGEAAAPPETDLGPAACGSVVELLQEIAALQRLELSMQEMELQTPTLGGLWIERGRLAERLEKQRESVAFLSHERDRMQTGSGDAKHYQWIVAQLDLHAAQVEDLERQIQRIDVQMADTQEAIARIRRNVAEALGE